jgi:chemotaxis protein histidine kinase CheA
MQERVESLGGSIKITSGLGKGTLIEVALPLPQRLSGSVLTAIEMNSLSSYGKDSDRLGVPGGPT